MSERQWIQKQLEASGEALIWAIAQIPEARRAVSPPEPLGVWSAWRHLFHMYYNEKNIVLPRIKRWLGGPRPDLSVLDEEAAWEATGDMAAIVENFKVGRAEHVRLVMAIERREWDVVRDIFLGPYSLHWVMMKSIQHTADHVNSILQMALFWDHYEARKTED